jgi:hypothetical protein
MAGDNASSVVGCVNDAVGIYFRDATSAVDFVVCWCAGSEAEVSDGAFRVRDDQPMRPVAAGPDRTF